MPQIQKKTLSLHKQSRKTQNKSLDENGNDQIRQHLGKDDGGQKSDTEMYSRGRRFEATRQETSCQVRYTPMIL